MIIIFFKKTILNGESFESKKRQLNGKEALPEEGNAS